MSEKTTNLQKIDLKLSSSLVDYQEAVDFMEARVKNILAQKEPDLLWFLEHPHVITMGSSARKEDILEPNITIHQTTRGGKTTYHGPGQRIVYIMMDLKNLYAPNKPDLRKFVADLEKWIMLSLAEINIESFLLDGKIGVWTRTQSGAVAKIAAVGIRVSKWISYHGIAINISPDLSYFKKIIPCGIQDLGVTSTAELGKNISLEEFDKILIQKFHEVFL